MKKIQFHFLQLGDPLFPEYMGWIGSKKENGRVRWRWYYDDGPARNPNARLVVALVPSPNCRWGARAVGLLKFEWRPVPKHWLSGGTWVPEDMRRNGIASKLWEIMLKRTEAKNVQVAVVSDNGLRLMQRVMQAHPNVQFDVSEQGGRKLRGVAL